MCGIAGIVRSQRPVDRTEIERMCAAIEHRGPDEGGAFVDGGVGLGIRRLSIVDLAGGTQPIANEDGTVVVIQNGEIYNFQSLRQELARRRHALRTRSDTECIVHAYEEFGDEFVMHLRGMFALAVWDARRERLILARDRLGKKPLVYAQLGGDLYFASEYQALLTNPNISREIDFGAMGDYLSYGYVPDPASIYASVRKLPPGHMLVWDRSGSIIRRYWQLRYEPKLRLGEREALEELERRLSEAVRLRLIADVELGALLSGGVDSSVVVALMAKLSGTRVKTFSIGFSEGAFNEVEHARRVAERWNTDHYEFVVKPDAAEVVSQLVRHYGEPYADSSAIPSFYVSKLARQHVTVALNGDGGDESFAGYDRYRAVWLAEGLRRLPGSSNLVEAGRLALEKARPMPARIRHRGLRMLQAAHLPSPQRYGQWMSVVPTLVQEELLAADVAGEIRRQRRSAVEEAVAANSALGLTDRLLAADVATYLPGDLLVKMDIASMANSLETRSPLLDQEVVEFAARLPSSLKLRFAWEQKYLLKRMARRLIPARNIDRPKMGFAVPIGNWLRGPLREWAADALISNQARERGYFRPEIVAALWKEHQDGIYQHDHALWALIMFELWHRQFQDQPSLTPAAATR